MSEGPKRPWSTLKKLLLIALLGGLWQVLVAVAIVPVLPLFQLDAVLTPDELHDAAIKEKTYDLLRRASGNQWLFWLVPGLIVSTASATGLWIVTKEPISN